MDIVDGHHILFVWKRGSQSTMIANEVDSSSIISNHCRLSMAIGIDGACGCDGLILFVFAAGSRRAGESECCDVLSSWSSVECARLMLMIMSRGDELRMRILIDLEGIIGHLRKLALLIVAGAGAPK